MKRSLTILFLLVSVFAKAQPAPQERGTDSAKLVTTLKEFHQALVNKNTVSINQQTDKALSYGHSNGWIETKNDMINNLETGYIKYNSIKEDSMRVTVNGNMAHARFAGDYNVTMNGNTNTYHLKVLEVWVKKGKRWILFARQAIR
ncbi:MAG: nuclear transport factor 2 family protein [Chitinophagaceae bacterium]|nr:nuclear transport factor 2 family protein [Chitinophagaceae bacterium]